MKGPVNSVPLLNDVLAWELIHINQTFLHARIAKNWGLKELNARAYHHSIAAMKRADQLIERVLLLEGLPNLQKLGGLRIGEDVLEMIQGDLTLCQGQRESLVEVIAQLERSGDYISRQLCEGILESIEIQIDWLETQNELIGQLGPQNYHQSLAED